MHSNVIIVIFVSRMSLSFSIECPDLFDLGNVTRCKDAKVGPCMQVIILTSNHVKTDFCVFSVSLENTTYDRNTKYSTFYPTPMALVCLKNP